MYIDHGVYICVQVDFYLVFTDVSEESGFGIPIELDEGSDVRDTHNAMGISVGDINNDGYPDLTYSNIGPNIMLQNDGFGKFVDVSVEKGIQRTDLPWGPASITWGTQFLDYDNDMDFAEEEDQYVLLVMRVCTCLVCFCAYCCFSCWPVSQDV